MEKLLTTYRGKIEDMYTFGSIAVVDSKGKLVKSRGDSKEIAFPRSSAKLLQALSPLSLGAKEKFDLTDIEIAQICASHSGEDFHIKTVANILKKAGFDESYLKCGPHYPFKKEIEMRMRLSGEKPRDIHNNCSGKHAGMLMATKLLGADPHTYYKLENPCQQRIIKILEKMCDYELKDENISIDGCGVPVHAMPLYNYALGMARLSDYENLQEPFKSSAFDIIRSITANPVYTSGSDRIDYYIISKYPGRVIVKSGANGYFGGMDLKNKYGFAIKTYDGISTTRNIILVELLKKLDIIKKEDYDYFDSLTDRTVRNHRGEKVGEVKVCF